MRTAASKLLNGACVCVTTDMSTVASVEHSRARIRNILESVPFGPGEESSAHFLSIYKITHAELASLNLSEPRWDLLFPIPAKKLLKLGISLGNLLKTNKLEQKAFELRHIYPSVRVGSDPFDDTSLPDPSIPPHHLLFVRNFLVILQNFDVGATGRPAGQSVTEDLSSTPSVLSGPSSSPIKLKTRQLLIEKLEININVDCLFIAKIVLKMIATLYDVMLKLIPIEPEEQNEPSTIRVYSESSLMFSKSSGMLNSLGEFFSAANEVVARVTTGIVEPLTGLFLEELVEPLVISSCQSLIAGL